MAKITCNGQKFDCIQAIVFDKDGTLANSEEFLWEMGQQRSHLINTQIPGIQASLLRSFGVGEDGINPSGMMAVGARRDNAIAAAAYVAETGRDWVESLDIVQLAFQQADQLMQPKARYTPLFEEGRSLLQKFHAAGIRIGILSSDVTENVVDFIQFYQLEPMVQVGLGVNGKPPKPDPTLLYEICSKLGAAPAETLVIGDATSDFRMAHLGGAAGSIGVTWGWRQRPELKEADAIAHRWDEIQIEAGFLGN